MLTCTIPVGPVVVDWSGVVGRDQPVLDALPSHEPCRCRPRATRCSRSRRRSRRSRRRAGPASAAPDSTSIPDSGSLAFVTDTGTVPVVLKPAVTEIAPPVGAVVSTLTIPVGPVVVAGRRCWSRPAGTGRTFRSQPCPCRPKASHCSRSRRTSRRSQPRAAPASAAPDSTASPTRDRSRSSPRRRRCRSCCTPPPPRSLRPPDAVVSTLIPVIESGPLGLPALSVAVALTLCGLALEESVVCVAGPPSMPQRLDPRDVVRAREADRSGAVLYQPFVPSGAAGEIACVMIGPVRVDQIDARDRVARPSRSHRRCARRRPRA